MADVRVDEEVVTKFLLNTCWLHQRLNLDSLVALFISADMVAKRELSDDDETAFIPAMTGSTAELHIQPMWSCVGDVDIMFHLSNQLAIIEGTAPPTQLPGEFDSRVYVLEIIDSQFPGYVYLMSSYLLTECVDDGKYNALECQRQYVPYRYENYDKMQGPALTHEWSNVPPSFVGRLAGARCSIDMVYCTRCLSWPPQAGDWPTRHRNYGWPDLVTIDRVVRDGCDVVDVAHPLCRQVEWMNTCQRRLSLSRAEILLLNSWTPVQQIVYHLLRVFAKTKQLTDSADNSDAAKLSNYHIKTLMLWACELKPRSWWIDDLNVVRQSVELLHTLGVWLTDARCPHYFIHNCNLFHHSDNWYCEIAGRLMSETKASLIEWFINSYIRKCAQLCPDDVARLFADVSNKAELEKAISAIEDSHKSLHVDLGMFAATQMAITTNVSQVYPTDVRLYLCWMRNLIKVDQRLYAYFTAITLLHVAYKTTQGPLEDELLDVSATICHDVRRCRNARHSSVLSLTQAAMLMKVVANNSHSTVQLIEIELSKAYLYRALRCKDSDSDSICCLVNVYSAVLYYDRGHYQTAIDHCTLVTNSQDHSQCSSHVVQGELLPKIDDDIDTVLGLAVFYQYLSLIHI